ncbi:hypothetical protein JHK87_039063 [Glycine soja]|nr:hypothetical protein JHK87_039063 [Glycine soja]
MDQCFEDVRFFCLFGRKMHRHFSPKVKKSLSLLDMVALCVFKFPSFQSERSSNRLERRHSANSKLVESFVALSSEIETPLSLIVLILAWLEVNNAKLQEHQFQWGGLEGRIENIASHSCIHDQILQQRKRPGRKVYSVTPQVYEPGLSKSRQHKGRALLGVSTSLESQGNEKQPIRIYLNYDAVGHSPDRDCQKVGDIVKLGEPPMTFPPGLPSCNPLADPPVFGDCWYNCTSEDISGEDKKHRLRKALGQTADWFRRALSVEPVKGNLRLSGYSACGQDGGVQLPHKYVEEGVSDADLVLLVTTRPTTGNTLAWAVACERDQWGRAIAGHVNVAPCHLTAEAETLLSATLIHEVCLVFVDRSDEIGNMAGNFVALLIVFDTFQVMHVLGFDPHAFAHFRDERKRRRIKVTEQVMDEKIGRTVTRVVLPRVVMHSRHHYAAFSRNFTGLELEDGGGRGTSGSHWEKRLLMNEIMTGSVDTRSVVSKMTLALLEDSGWYKANYSMADRLDWGRNQGTQFVTSTCNLWKGAYHCNTTQFSGCTYNREAEGYCPILTYNGDLPQWAQYFPQANKGGQSSLADYCTYFVAYSDGSCTDTSSARAPDRMLGEVRGSNSRCMTSSLVRTGFVRGSLAQGNGCYQHKCINNSLEVAVDGIWKVCPRAGGPILFPGFNVHVISTETVLMEGATAFLDFMVTIAVDVPAPAIALAMARASPVEYVNVKLAILALTVLLLSVMSNAAFMVGFVIMEFANFAVLTMRDILARTAPCSSPVFQFAEMFWEMIFPGSIVLPVNLAYYSS